MQLDLDAHSMDRYIASTSRLLLTLFLFPSIPVDDSHYPIVILTLVLV